MKHPYFLKLFFVILLGISCNSRTEIKVVDAKMKEVRDSTNKPPDPPQTNLRVSAYLIYNDGSISSFDVLNDKSITLRNTKNGGGDAFKPSTKVELVLNGYVEDLLVRIKNGQRPIVENKASNFTGQIRCVIKNTGCEEVSINVFGRNKLLYSGTIPFHCDK